MYNKNIIYLIKTGFKSMRKNLAEPSSPKEIEAFRPKDDHAKKLAVASDAGLNKSEIINRCLDNSLESVLRDMQSQMMVAFNRFVDTTTGGAVPKEDLAKIAARIAHAATPVKPVSKKRK